MLFCQSSNSHHSAYMHIAQPGPVAQIRFDYVPDDLKPDHVVYVLLISCIFIQNSCMLDVVSNTVPMTICTASPTAVELTQIDSCMCAHNDLIEAW